MASEEVGLSLLQDQQVQLGIVRAARSLLGHQGWLQQLLAHSCPACLLAPTDDDDTSTSLLRHLLTTATQPAPLKAVFSREELLVGASCTPLEVIVGPVH